MTAPQAPETAPPAPMSNRQILQGDVPSDGRHVRGDPCALPALITVVFLKEKPLKTISGMERLAEESGPAADTDKAAVGG